MAIITLPVRPPARWHAVATYKTDAGFTQETIEFEEFDELGQAIEDGPHWDCIGTITIRLNPARRTFNGTVEQAERQ